MKKLLFSTICLSALCVGANAGTYSGISLGFLSTSKTIFVINGKEYLDKNNWDVNGYIKTYKEHEVDSEFVWNFEANYFWNNYKYKFDDIVPVVRNSQFDFSALIGYGMFFNEDYEDELSLNLMGGLAYHRMGIKGGANYGIKGLKFGFSALSKPFDTKKYMVTLDAYYNFYLSNDYFDDVKKDFDVKKSRNAYDISVGMLFNTTESRFSPYVSSKLGVKDNLFSQKNNNIYINLGLGFHF